MDYIRDNYNPDSDSHNTNTNGKAEDATNVTANDIKKIDIEKLKELINSEKEGLGKDAINSLAIICKKHKNFKSNSEPFLVEMRFQLKAQLGKTLSDSINRAAKFRVEGCGTKEQNVPVNIVPYMQVMNPPQAH